MALVKCKDCETKISRRAKSCPSCGAPNKPEAGIISTGCGCLILLIGVFICAGLLTTGDSNPDPPAPQQNASGANPNSTPVAQQSDELLKYKTLRKWSPDNSQSALGMEILISGDNVTEAELKNLLRHLSNGYDPAVILIYTSQIAYDQDKSMNYGPEYKRGYLLFFVRNQTGRGLYSGANEIRWFQEVGKFASKFGTTTPM